MTSLEGARARGPDLSRDDVSKSAPHNRSTFDTLGDAKVEVVGFRPHRLGSRPWIDLSVA